MPRAIAGGEWLEPLCHMDKLKLQVDKSHMWQCTVASLLGFGACKYVPGFTLCSFMFFSVNTSNRTFPLLQQSRLFDPENMLNPV